MFWVAGVTSVSGDSSNMAIRRENIRWVKKKTLLCDLRLVSSAYSSHILLLTHYVLAAVSWGFDSGIAGILSAKNMNMWGLISAEELVKKNIKKHCSW